MIDEVVVPKELQTIQEFFGSFLHLPINKFNHNLESLLPKHLKKQIATIIKPSTALNSFSLLQIYHQQYWWRIIDFLDNMYPLLVRLLGKENFESKLAIPFFSHLKPKDWRLLFICDNFIKWLKNFPFISCEQLESAILDNAYYKAYLSDFIVPKTNTIDIHAPFILQDCISVLSFQTKICEYREEMLKQSSEYWNNHPLPTLEKKRMFYIVYRNPYENTKYEVIDFFQFEILSKLKKGTSIEYLSKWLKEAFSDEEQIYISTKLVEWFQKWTKKQWLIPLQEK